MADIIMIFSGAVFAMLFLFLMFVFVTSLISLFNKEKDIEYEPKLSVIIPCYNEERNVQKCLDSVFGADYPKSKMEVVVVDDGSTDRTIDVLKEYKKKEKRLVIVKGDHQGKSAGLNKGAMKAKYDIILTVDADTVIKPDSIKKLVKPFYYKNVGATNGSCVVGNKNSILTGFQNIEYHYNNLIRKSFSNLFKNGIWFFGAFACYRRDVLEKIGYFKKDTLTEDMDTALEIFSAGYKIVNVHDALGYTIVPETFFSLAKQRTRWWAGVLQSLQKNGHLFRWKSGPSILFLFINQYWWSFFAIASIPLIAYQFNYWLPYNLGSLYDFFIYTFGWFSLFGAARVIYMIPVWGISPYSIFGVLSGIMSAMMIIAAIYLFKDKLTLRNIASIFFYFPYTILLNSIIVGSLIRIIFLKRKYFIA